MSDLDQDQLLRELPEVKPKAAFDAHLRGVLAHAEPSVPALPIAGRVLLFGSVALYLGWALNAAAALVR